MGYREEVRDQLTREEMVEIQGRSRQISACRQLAPTTVWEMSDAAAKAGCAALFESDMARMVCWVRPYTQAG